jgi:hypothetical protein
MIAFDSQWSFCGRFWVIRLIRHFVLVILDVATGLNWILPLQHLRGTAAVGGTL